MSLHSHNYNCGSDECLIIPQGYPEKKKAYIATQGDTFTKLLLFHLPYSFLSYYFHHTFALSLALFLSLLLSLTSFSFILALLHSLLLTLLTLPILPLHLHYLRYSFFLFLFLAIIFDTASRRPNGADSQQILGDGVGLSDPYHRHAHSLR